LSGCRATSCRTVRYRPGTRGSMWIPLEAIFGRCSGEPTNPSPNEPLARRQQFFRLCVKLIGINRVGLGTLTDPYSPALRSVVAYSIKDNDLKWGSRSLRLRHAP